MEVKITKAEAVLTERDVLTSGMVGKTVTLAFSQDWDGLLRTAVFRAGNETRAVILNGDARTETAVIPHEVLRTPERMLRMGVYGTDAAGTEVLPTVWCELGTVQPGVDPAGDEGTEATPDVWAQMWCLIETLDKSKAPAGHGYGEKLTAYKVVDEAAFNTALSEIVSGMPNLSTKQVAFNLKDYLGTEPYWLATVYRYSSKVSMVKCSVASWGGTSFQKIYMNGAWQPMEWVNPPLGVGIPYRTTERWNGKPVYVTLVNFEKLPDKETKSKDHGIENIDRVIRTDCTAYSATSAFNLPYGNATEIGYVYANKTAVKITTTATLGTYGYSAYVAVYYTKTTD